MDYFSKFSHCDNMDNTDINRNDNVGFSLFSEEHLCSKENTPLHYLIMRNFHVMNNEIIKKIRFLLLDSPELNTKNKFTGSTPMHYLMMLLKEKQRKSVDMIPYFMLLLECIDSDGDMKIENNLKIKPIDIFNEIMNIVDCNGNTLLFHFVIKKEYYLAIFAIEYGVDKVDIARQNNESKTILDYALKNASENIDNILQHMYFINFLHWRFNANNREIMMSSFEKVNLSIFFDCMYFPS